MVWNRTRERAERLVADLGGRVVDAPEPAALIVNCTSVGLREADLPFKSLPIEADTLGVGSYVVDMVYRPGGTPLLAEAQAAGGDGGDGAGDPGRPRRSVVRALDRHDRAAQGHARRRRPPRPNHEPTDTSRGSAQARTGKPKRATASRRRRGAAAPAACSRDVIVDLGFVEREAMDEAVEMAHSAGSAAERVLVSHRRDHRGRARARGRRALRPRPPRPAGLPRRPRRGQARHAGRDQALPGGAGLVRRRPHAARRDVRPGQRARGRRHRGDDGLRGAPGRRVADRHRLRARAHRRPELGQRQRRRARVEPPTRRRSRPRPPPPAAPLYDLTPADRQLRRRAARTPRSSSSCSG